MSAVDVLAVMYAAETASGSVGWNSVSHSLMEARAAVAELIEAQRGCRDMLRESAKQFRLSGDAGHARHCDALADKADAALARVGGGK